MYPGVIIEFDDQSDITPLPIAEVRNMPLYMAVFSSDKGTEEWTRVSGSRFFDIYGKQISFAKHGQPLLQAAMSINTGAELLCKRLVAEDATLANIAIVATVTGATTEEVQKTNAEGQLLYVDGEGNETTENSGTPAMETKTTGPASITYELKSVAGMTVDAAGKIVSPKDVANEVKKNLAEGQYLLYVLTDTGRGESKKRIRIVPNYRLSRSLTYVSYTLYVLEGVNETESFSFSANPDLIVNGQNISLQSMINTNSSQLKCYEDRESIIKMAEVLAESAGYLTATGDPDTDTMFTQDILFGLSSKGEAIDGITGVDTSSDNSKDLQYMYGQMLQSGTNGSFGEKPFSLVDNTYVAGGETLPDAWTKAAIAAFDGSFDKVIYNLDQFKIHALFDANYPPAVKRTIEALAAFREDFMYYRDQNLGVVSYDIAEERAGAETKSMFCNTYCQSYDVIDPYTYRQITVTSMYDLSIDMVGHWSSGSIAPPAGKRYDMILNNAIYGTVSYLPTIAPGVNEKDKLEDIKINYASYIDNELVVETVYTSYERNSQWSYINNVMGIQDVVKAIRTRCPAIRYSFINGTDLKEYRNDVVELINQYSSDYLNLSLEFVTDAKYSANKIFYAVLKVTYKDFVQTEWFKITAISTESAVTE